MELLQNGEIVNDNNAIADGNEIQLTKEQIEAMLTKVPPKLEKVAQSIENVHNVLTYDKELQGKIVFDEFENEVFIRGAVPWDKQNCFRMWQNADDSRLLEWLESNFGLNNEKRIFHALQNTAHDRKFHQVRNVLEQFKWDRQEHIRHLLPDYLGAEDTDYNAAVMKLWMLGAVARVYQAGCKFDYMPIVKGGQGIGKSTLFKLLALDDRWFTDSIDSLDGDKAAQSLRGIWIAEFGELKALARTTSGVDGVKKFVSATQDRYRKPYARNPETYLRQCVFVGTTNNDEFLQDDTGNRRFLIIEAGIHKASKDLFDRETVIPDIQQAWAEAVYIWKTERPALVLPKEYLQEAEQMQEAAMQTDTRIGIIQEYLQNKERTCAAELWEMALDENGRPNRNQAMQINSIVKNYCSEWTKMETPQKFGKYGSQRGFIKKQSDEFSETSEPTPFDS